jgi:TRAP-type mannitol/chloroaromatic compound transport system permease small subunit
MAQLIRLARGIDALNTAIGRAAAWAIVVAIVVSALNAIIRKAFGVSSNAWLELQWYLFGAVFMLCAAWTLKVNEHIRIDIISSKLTKRGRDTIEMLGHLAFLFPFALLLTALCIPFFWISYRTGEVSNSAGGLTLWPAKLLILVGFILLLLQFVSELIKRIAIIRGEMEDTQGPAGHMSAAEAEAERLLAAAEAERVLATRGAPGDGGVKT